MSEFDDELEVDWGDGPRLRAVAGRLVLLRQALALRPAGLAKSLGTSRTSVGNWESGAKQPTHFLGRLAEVYDVAPLALGLPEPEFISSGPFFRSQGVSVERHEEQAVAVARLYGDIATYFERRVGLDLPAIPDLSGYAPDEAAREVRRMLRVRPGPIMNVIRLARTLGAIAVYAPKILQSIDAYSVHTTHWPLIVMTPKGNFYRQRWDVAHELGHLLLHAHVAGHSEQVEDEANAFAAELLLPAVQIVDLLPMSVNRRALEEFKALKETWGVSISALIRRSRELGIMHDATYAFAQGLLDANGYRRAEPGLIEDPEIAVVIPDAVDQYVRLGFDLEKVRREVGVPSQLFDAAISLIPLDIAPRRADIDH